LAHNRNDPAGAVGCATPAALTYTTIERKGYPRDRDELRVAVLGQPERRLFPLVF
jgi:hypothetical protein